MHPNGNPYKPLFACMKHAICVVVLVVARCYSFGQAPDFQTLLGYYGQENQEIDSSNAAHYFSFKHRPGVSNLHAGKILFKNSRFWGLTAEYHCGAGGICEGKSLSIISSDGSKLDVLSNFEGQMADCGFHNIRACIFSTDTLLIFKDQRTKTDCSEDSVISNKVSLDYVFIQSDGKFAKPITRPVNTRRKYYRASCEFLKDYHLRHLSSFELAAMRNEIFAAHGYVFKKPQWKEYFEKLDWYNPGPPDQELHLSMIERHNVELIQAVESRR